MRAVATGLSDFNWCLAEIIGLIEEKIWRSLPLSFRTEALSSTEIKLLGLDIQRKPRSTVVLSEVSCDFVDSVLGLRKNDLRNNTKHHEEDVSLKDRAATEYHRATDI